VLRCGLEEGDCTRSQGMFCPFSCSCARQERHLLMISLISSTSVISTRRISSLVSSESILTRGRGYGVDMVTDTNQQICLAIHPPTQVVYGLRSRYIRRNDHDFISACTSPVPFALLGVSHLTCSGRRPLLGNAGTIAPYLSGSILLNGSLWAVSSFPSFS
jgi:hypothetical protein